MKKLYLVIIALLFTMLFSGCGENPKDYSESALVFSKKGSVTDVIVENFGQPYYDLNGLNTFFNEKINEFKASTDKGTVLLSSIEVDKGIARAVLEFDSAETYQKFYNIDCFYGTINDAYDAGYGLNVTLKEVNGSDTIKKEDLMGMQKEKIIIIGDQIQVITNEKIKYVSANVEVINNKNVRISSDSSGLAYLVLE